MKDSQKKKQKKQNRKFRLPLIIIPLVLFICLVIVTTADILVKEKVSKNNLRNLPFNYSVGLYPNIDKNLFPQTSAEGVVVMDRNSKTIIYSKNSDLRFAPASTTKIMTALVALEYYKRDDILTVGNIQSEESTLRFREGDKLRFEDLLYAMLLPSSNDAALIIAGNYPGGEPAFVARMNEKAKEFNLSNTFYKEPVGLADYGNYTSPIDLANLASYAMQNPEFAKVVGTRDKVIDDADNTAPTFVQNLNVLLGFSGVNGVKTGYTEEAGEVLVTSKVIDTPYGRQSIIIVVMQSDDRFGDSEKIINALQNLNYLSIHQ